MKELFTTILPIMSAVATVVGLIVAFVKGRKAKRLYQSLTRKEQENVLYNYMVEEAKKIQKKSKFFQPNMGKQQVAEEKHDTVIEKVTMFARGAGYTWYDEIEWSNKLVTLLSDAKELQN